MSLAQMNGAARTIQGGIRGAEGRKVAADLEAAAKPTPSRSLAETSALSAPAPRAQYTPKSNNSEFRVAEAQMKVERWSLEASSAYKAAKTLSPSPIPSPSQNASNGRSVSPSRLGYASRVLTLS